MLGCVSLLVLALLALLRGRSGSGPLCVLLRWCLLSISAATAAHHACLRQRPYATALVGVDDGSVA